MSPPEPDYFHAFANARMRRERNILLVELTSGGGPLVWEERAHRELPRAFAAIGEDPENHVVILTGTGDSFCAGSNAASWTEDRRSADFQDRLTREAKQMLGALLNIDVPIIGAVNGPARIHAEIVLLSDVVIASETALFQDGVHFTTGGVPGDGVHTLWPMWLGPNRGRYFLLMGEEIEAREALKLGIVNEVHPPELLLDRAWEIAERFIQRPRLTLRFTRLALTMDIKRRLDAELERGLILEAAAKMGMTEDYITDRGGAIRPPGPMATEATG